MCRTGPSIPLLLSVHCPLPAHQTPQTLARVPSDGCSRLWPAGCFALVEFLDRKTACEAAEEFTHTPVVQHCIIRCDFLEEPLQLLPTCTHKRRRQVVTERVPRFGREAEGGELREILFAGEKESGVLCQIAGGDE